MKSKRKTAMGFLMAFVVIFIGSADIVRAQNSSSEHSPGGQALKPVQGSKIVFEEDEFDFGQIPYNRKVTHTFRFRNPGTSPLMLARNAMSIPVVGC